MPAAQMFAHDDPGIVSAENIASNWRKAVRSTATVQKVSDQVALSKPAPQLVANP